MAIIHNLVAKFRADTGAFDRNVNKSRTHMTRFGRDMQTMGKQLLAFAGVGGGLYAVKRGLEYIVRAALEQEKSQRSLAAAVQGSITQYKYYAAEMQKVTVYGDEQILSQMAYAKNLGVTNDKLQEATTAAIGLAARYRLDLASAMMLVGRASQGQTQMLTRYGIVIDQTLSKEKKFDEVLRVGTNSFRLAEEQTRENASAFGRLRNEIGDYAEILGGPLADAISENARKSTDFMSRHKYEFARWISDMEEGVGMVKKFELSVLDAYKTAYSYTPWGLLYKQYKKLTKPEPIAKLPSIEEMDRITRQEMINKGIEDMMKGEKALQELRRIGRNRTLDALIEEGKKTKQFGENQKRIYTDIARGMAGEWSNAFDQMLFEGKKFAEAMNDLLRGILRMVMQILTYEMIAKPIAAGIMGVPASELHSGGIVGQTATRNRQVPALAFARAPRLHSGFAYDEYPAILQRGEEVIPRGGGGGGGNITQPISVVIQNIGGVPLKSAGQSMYDGKQLIIKVVAEDIQQGGALRKLFQTLK